MKNLYYDHNIILEQVVNKLTKRTLFGFLAIVLYLLIILCLSVISNHCYNVYINRTNNDKQHNLKLSWVYVLVFSLAFAFYNRALTENSLHEGLSGDRLNYQQDFYGRDTGYVGYDFYDELIHRFTENFNLYMYITTFICCIGIFIAYNLHHKTNPKSLMILMCTPIVFFTFTGYKQCMSCIFVMIYFSIMSFKSSRKRNLFAIICIILASSFHSSAYLLIPIFLFQHKNRRYRFDIVLMAFTIAFIFLEPFCRWLAITTSPFVPQLSSKILEYFAEETIHEKEGSVIVFLKGFPYYFLTIIGFVKRAKISKKIKSYDTYLFLTLIATMSYAASGISYWLSRMTALFYLPVSILALMIFENEDNPKYALYEKCIFIGSLSFFTFRSVFLTIYNYGGY